MSLSYLSGMGGTGRTNGRVYNIESARMKLLTPQQLARQPQANPSKAPSDHASTHG